MSAKKIRLDQLVLNRKLAVSRSQAENLIRLGQITVNGEVVTKPGHFVSDTATVQSITTERYVSRAALKLASVAESFNLDFKGKAVLDVGSSTGGFTDYALQHGASKVIAVDVGSNQLHPSLRSDKRVELHEQTDIRELQQLSTSPNIVVIDVSFISLREVLPFVAQLARDADIVAMLKPQFEAGPEAKHKGVIKNERMRRDIIQQFEQWVKQRFVVLNKADSKVEGTKGNQERFYLLKTH